MRFVIALISVATLVDNVGADESIVITGLGAASCAQFSQLYSMNPHTTENIYLDWSRGFMSGLNAARWPSGPYRDLRAKTPEQLNVHARQYCEAHPLANYMQAVMDFFMSLPLRSN